ncbi:MAG: radical SAM protein [Desulfobacterales bacterium]|nr:radical SAM protein [Desulfobacterales bacterium]MDP6806692.1 radical SAM protein [Desulfobacterales bacterium]
MIKSRKSIIHAVKSSFNLKPWYLIFAVTGRCNLRCAMCFYHENLTRNNQKHELALTEIEQIAPHFSNIYQLTLTGGEPLLRDDCSEIAKTFAKHTPVKRITLTTNGTLPERIKAFVTNFCKTYPNINLSVNLSIDGIREHHDRIRGAPGSFDRLMKSYDLLDGLMKDWPNLSRATATTVSQINEEEIFELLEFIDENLKIEEHGLMLARGDMPDKHLSNVSQERFIELIDILYYKKKKGQRIVSYAIDDIYKKRWSSSLREHQMTDPCFAGEKLLILDEYGNVYPCELLEVLRKNDELNHHFDEDFVFGNLRRFDYDINRILKSSKVKKINQFIRNKGCTCTFECALINNFYLNRLNWFRILFKIVKERKVR